MGFRDHVSTGLLLFYARIWLVLRDCQSAEAAQTSDIFIDYYQRNPSLLEYSGNWTLEMGGWGRNMWPDRIRFKENTSAPLFSFNTKFRFLLIIGPPHHTGYGTNNVSNNLEGFTFAMLPSKFDASSGGDGGYLGLLNATSNGDPNAHTFAVEFDFLSNREFSDPNDYHFGIDINSMNSTASAPMTESGRSVPGYWLLQVWINYDSSTSILNVTIADNDGNDGCPLSSDQPPDPAQYYPDSTDGIVNSSLSQKVDLTSVLNEYMYVGFTSSSKKGLSQSVLQSWSLKTTSSGPSAPSAALPCDRPASESFAKLTSILLILTSMAVIYGVLYEYYSRWVERRGWRFNIDVDDLQGADVHKFSYKELALATKNFDPKQALGRGGFGSVYKGFLPGNKEFVAVKRVAAESDQGEREFIAEVMTIGKIRHRNLVRLQEWCHERGELLLVYDLMPHGSLDKLLFGLHNAPEHVFRYNGSIPTITKNLISL